MTTELEIEEVVYKVYFCISSGSSGSLYPRYGAPYPAEPSEVEIGSMVDVETDEEIDENLFNQFEDVIKDHCLRESYHEW